MRLWWLSAVLAAACWMGVLWPLLLLVPLAGWGWCHGRPWLLVLPLFWCYGLLQLHQGIAAVLPGSLEGETLSLQGQVVGLPVTANEFRFGRWRVRQTLTVEVWGAARWPGRHRIRVNAYGLPVRVRAGQHLALTVKLKAPRGVYNATGIDIARRDLAAGIAARGTVKSWTIRGGASGLAVWREQISQRVADQVSASPAGRAILPALVVGDRSGLSSTLWQQFQATGGAHLLAISGLHIAIVAGWFWWLGRWLIGPLVQRVLPRLQQLTLQQLAWMPALLAASGYAALAGFSLPTIRAVLMLSVVAVARCARVPLPLWQSLAMALLLVLLVFPLSALSESLWLSFGAVAVIAVLVTSHSARWLMILLPAVMTLVGALLFQQWSMSAPLANLLLVPLYTCLVVPLALLGTLLQQPWLLEGAATGTELSVWLMASLAELTGNWRLALPGPRSGFFALLALVLMLLPALPFPRRLLPLLLLPWLFQGPETLEEGEWELTAFDVGQGLALTVRTREHLLVYDTGASWPGGSMAQRIIVPWLSRQGLTPDRIIISHGDNDHAGGLADLAGRAPVFSGESGRVSGSRPCHAGQQWHWDGVAFAILWPPEDTGRPRGNDASCVLQVSANGRRLLVPGDIGKQSEYRLLGALEPVDMLVVPHHGSKTSSSAALLRQARPAYALVSAGYRNRFGHPHPQVLQRLGDADVTVLRTDRDGMIVFRWGAADNVPLITKWRQFRERPWHRPAAWRFW
ncbi:MAG: DNA internalization-related competence protein ComEC/Rec2 [Pseudomonadota bacterium]|nr:DNA internalization-related competence protein ComEC/Rec2 [Pseudomonadota bacterium]